MATPTLIEERFEAGIWHVAVSRTTQDPPAVVASLDGVQLAAVDCRKAPQGNHWMLRVPVPAHLLHGGVQTVVLSLPDGSTISSLAIMAGAAVAEDLRAEIGLLRNELDLLKSVVRRLHHRIDTTPTIS